MPGNLHPGKRRDIVTFGPAKSSAKRGRNNQFSGVIRVNKKNKTTKRKYPKWSLW